MNIALKQKIHSLLGDNQSATITGISSDVWTLLYKNIIKFNNKNVYAFPTEDEAEKYYLDHKEDSLLFYPDHDDGVFEGIDSSEINLYKRFSVLRNISKNKDISIVTTIKALNILMPPLSYFSNDIFEVSLSDIISPRELARKLVSLGYSSSPSVEERGSFSTKGEIFDIYTASGEAFRLGYFDDMIEQINLIDLDTNRTINSNGLESIIIDQMPQSVLYSNNLIQNFKQNFPRPKNSNRELIKYRESIFEKVNEGALFRNYPLFYSLFFNDPIPLINILIRESFTFHFFSLEEGIKNFEMSVEKDLESIQRNIKNEAHSDILPPVESVYNIELKLDFPKLIINSLDFDTNFESDITNKFKLNSKSIEVYLNENMADQISLKMPQRIINLIRKERDRNKTFYFAFIRENSKSRFIQLLKENNIDGSRIYFLNSFLEKGFYYPVENSFFISEFDFLTQKINKTKRAKNSNTDVFAEQLATLNINDYVIHKNHGIGQYKGIETIELNNTEADYLVIHYSDEDKVFVPMYKMNLIQKYTNSAANVKVASLKTKKFDQEKNKARNSVKKLAFDLLEIQAKRAAQRGFKFSDPDELFLEFEQKFKYQETPDQLKAIDDVIADMCSEKPMDRLICGDVGFGKTEIAMRASFKAILDKKQVAILVPTTVLALQHFNTMSERFKDFPVNIHLTSRFRSAKQIKETLELTKEGVVDILIGTHKILSDKVKFKDLGLLIIDEEQRFGVGHKEKIKSLKANIDCLTMTATPIPRTLQMSFLGIKDFSLIQTPPPKRQSIKTYLIKDEPITLQNAIKKELSRGGQVFIVHNRVNDIEEYTAKIKKLAPEAKVVFAHGQMGEKLLEEKISDFYSHKFDILVSTTIIESGIDIPNANTMIVDKANMYGLSQLHQLRGRIGRSDKKAYAYFIVPFDRNISSIAAKRLKALQTYTEIGAGFSLATSDLEIRGSGDILGGEQSGHIANIGLELYMELLKEAIGELKNESFTHTQRDIEVQTPFKSLIPENYIENPGQRLRYYKKLSNCSDISKLDEIKSELNDVYGLTPDSLNNLFSILESRISLNHLPLKSIKVLSSSIILNFDKILVEQNSLLQEKIVQFFISRPKVYKLKPNYSVTCKFKDQITIDTLLEFAKYIAVQIEAC